MERQCLRAVVSLLVFGLAPAVAPAQEFGVVHLFNRSAEGSPHGPLDLVKGEDDTLFGVTRFGGESCLAPEGGSCGVVFELGPGGLRAIFELDPVSDVRFARLSRVASGELYVTAGSQQADAGRLIELQPLPAGTWPSKTLHVFPGRDRRDAGCRPYRMHDGRLPHGPLLVARDGRFYGTTVAGGSGGPLRTDALGTLFSLTPDPAEALPDPSDGSDYRLLHAFTGEDFDDLEPCEGMVAGTGAYPSGRLVQGADGHVYGTTYAGGSEDPDGTGHGTVFRYRTGGADEGLVERVHAFSGSGPFAPWAGLTRGRGGRLFGTTRSGGPGFEHGAVFVASVSEEVGALATVTPLHAFSAAEGFPTPYELVQAPDGFLYGTTYGSGHGAGAVYRLRPDGSAFSLVHVWSGGEDGKHPSSPLVLGPEGELYGTTLQGGRDDAGVVYTIRLGLKDRIAALARAVDELAAEGAIARSAATSLASKPRVALWFLQLPPDGDRRAAGNMLDLFVWEADHLVRNGALAPDVAQPLTDAARGLVQRLRRLAASGAPSR